MSHEEQRIEPRKGTKGAIENCSVIALTRLPFSFVTFVPFWG